MGRLNPHIKMTAAITGHSYFKMWGVDGLGHIKEANTKETPRIGVWRDYIFWNLVQKSDLLWGWRVRVFGSQPPLFPT